MIISNYDLTIAIEFLYKYKTMYHKNDPKQLCLLVFKNSLGHSIVEVYQRDTKISYVIVYGSSQR